MRGSAVLEIPDVPPSLNRIGTRGSHHAVNRAKKNWQEQIMWELLRQKVPKGLTRVEASVVFRFKDRRRRDPGNFSWLIEKALGDALAPHDPQHPHRFLPDDTAEFFCFRSPAEIIEPGKPLTSIRLAWEVTRVTS